MNSMFREEILRLKAEKRAMILAHYYQTMDIQEIADMVGDSFEMARRAAEAEAELLVVCGVRFMAESAKILSPQKMVLLPAPDAGCPMADMITPEQVRELRAKYPGAAVVCYVNSSAAVKAECDICCTSSSAERVVRSLPQRQIVFVPDQNLGHYVAAQVPEKEVILFEGCCPIHHRVTLAQTEAARRAHPEAKLLVHPECKPEVVAAADYVGSTAGILNYVLTTDAPGFLIGTEEGVAARLRVVAPEKKVWTLTAGFTCPNMKKTKLSDIAHVLRTGENAITLPPAEMEGARRALEAMIRV